MSGLSRSAQRIQDLLSEHGGEFRVLELPASTRTAQDAAAAIGCRVEQIAKSLVFRTVDGAQPVLVVASGKGRVDEARVAACLGRAVEKADADYVRAATGFAIGGVPPLGHVQPITTLIDEELMALGELWAAAGTPNAVFRLDAVDLPRLTGGTWLRLR